VDGDGAHRIRIRLVDVRHRRQVEHDVRASRALHQRIEVADVDRKAGDIGAVRGAHVEHQNFVTLLDELIDHVRAHETGPADPRDPHHLAPSAAVTVAGSRSTLTTASITTSASSSDMSEWMGKHTCRAHTSSATGSGPCGTSANTGSWWSGRAYTSPLSATPCSPSSRARSATRATL